MWPYSVCDWFKCVLQMSGVCFISVLFYVCLTRFALTPLQMERLLKIRPPLPLIYGSSGLHPIVHRSEHLQGWCRLCTLWPRFVASWPGGALSHTVGRSDFRFLPAGDLFSAMGRAVVPYHLDRFKVIRYDSFCDLYFHINVRVEGRE